jgi:hypothetical protein
VTDQRRDGIKDSGSSDLPMSILVRGMGEKGGIQPDYNAEDCKMCTRNRAQLEWWSLLEQFGCSNEVGFEEERAIIFRGTPARRLNEDKQKCLV